MPVWKLEDGVQAGRIIKPHSYSGLVRVAFLFSGLEDYLEKGDYLFIEFMEKPVPYLIEEIRWTDDATAIIRLAEVDSEEKAIKLKGRNIILAASGIPDEVFEEQEEVDFTGFRVLDMKGEELGKVTALIESGPQSLLEVSRDGKEFLIPVHEDLIKKINYRRRTIQVDLPEGLMDL
jgi:16S rRNA processing protein RimM